MNVIYYHTLPIFEHYFQPNTIEEAVSLLAQYGEEARILAGGTDLLVLMRSRNLAPRSIIDITRIPGLDYIRHDEKGALVIGALVTLRAAEGSRRVREESPPLYEAVRQMAMPQVRNMGTIAGNVCRASPSGDTIPPLLAMKAGVEIVGPHGSRVVPLDQFFMGPGETVLNLDEIVTEILIPGLPAGTGTAFLRITRSKVDLAKVNVASVLTMKEGTCEDARIALGGVAPTPIRAFKAEGILKGSRLENGIIEEAARSAADEVRPLTDIRSSKEYRKEQSKVLTRRAIRLSCERALPGTTR